MGNRNNKPAKSVLISLQNTNHTKNQALNRQSTLNQSTVFNKTVHQDINHQFQIPISPNETFQYPYNCIGLLYSQSGIFGNGFLIGPNLVLTAGHNVCILKQKIKQHLKLSFFISSKSISDSKKQQTISLNGVNTHGIGIKSIRTPNDFDNKLRYDFSLLKLQEEIPRQQYIEVGLVFNQIKHQKLSIIYYEDMNKDAKNFQLKRIDKQNNYQISKSIRLDHNFNTNGGSSGAPIFIQRQNKMIAIAIHKGLINKQNKRRLDRSKSVGRLIDEELLTNLSTWQKQFYLQDYISSITSYVSNEQRLKKRECQKGMESFIIFVQQEKKILQNMEKQCKHLQQVVQQLINKLQQTGSQKLHFESIVAEQMNPEKTKCNEYKEVQFVQVVQQHVELIKPNKYMKKEEKKIQINRKTVVSQKQNIQKVQISKFKKEFWDMSTPQSNRYKVVDNKIILKNDDNARYQLTSRQPLSYYANFSFFIEKYGGQRDICFGIIKDNRKRCQSSGKCQDSLGVWLGGKKSKIIIDGQIENEIPHHCSPQNTIKMQVDFGLMELYLWNCNVKKTVTKIPQHYRDKNIYLFVVLANRNDTISVSI